MTAKTQFLSAMLALAVGGVLLLVGGTSAMGFIALAGIAAIVATSSWLRIVIAALITLWAGVVVLASAMDQPGIALAGALLAALGGAFTVVRSRSWPSMGRRYERTTVASTNFWDAQDRGQDPTDDLVE